MRSILWVAAILASWEHMNPANSLDKHLDWSDWVFSFVPDEIYLVGFSNLGILRAYELCKQSRQTSGLKWLSFFFCSWWDLSYRLQQSWHLESYMNICTIDSQRLKPSLRSVQGFPNSCQYCECTRTNFDLKAHCLECMQWAWNFWFVELCA
jgi:hypothetical protein